MAAKIPECKDGSTQKFAKILVKGALIPVTSDIKHDCDSLSEEYCKRAGAIGGFLIAETVRI